MEMTLNLLGGGEEGEDERSEGVTLVLPFIPQLLSYLSSVIRGEGGRREKSLQLEFSFLAK